jgi:predicted NodU family carbamoyl transferase
MRILGLNNGIDAGAAILEDGHVVCAVNEERLNRKKMFWGPPLLSAGEALRIAGVDPKEIDWVAQSSISGGGGVHDDFLHPPPIKRMVETLSRFPLSHTDFVKTAYLRTSGRDRKDPVVDARLAELGVTAPKRFIEHHHCHAFQLTNCFDPTHCFKNLNDFNWFHVSEGNQSSSFSLAISFAISLCTTLALK